MRILYITDEIPYPVISGSPLYSNNLVRRLAQKHEVWMAAFVVSEEQEEGIPKIEEFCKGVITAPMVMGSGLSRPVDFFRFLLSGKPPDLRLYLSDEFTNKLRQITSEVHFDVVEIEHTEMGLYLQVLPADLRKKSVWVLQDIDWNRFVRIAQLEKRLLRKIRVYLHAKMMRIWKPRYAEQFARVTTVSQRDKDLMLEVNPKLKVEVIPVGVDTQVMQPLPDTNPTPTILFVGNMGYVPNAEGITYFCRDILPLIRKEIPDVEVWIVGINPLPEVLALAEEHIHVTGRVEDIRPYYERCQVSIIPLRAAGGARLKILESMALKRPVVTTTIGQEGQSNLVDGQHMMIADNTEEFAEKTIRLLKDRNLRQRITDEAYQFVIENYDWDSLADKLSRMLEEIVQN
ncbi:MAG: glycosyltransferase [Anaerolineae bacterium]|nr:glycosyltransferase [Anaerolineae bacterium]